MDQDSTDILVRFERGIKLRIDPVHESAARRAIIQRWKDESNVRV